MPATRADGLRTSICNARMGLCIGWTRPPPLAVGHFCFLFSGHAFLCLMMFFCMLCLLFCHGRGRPWLAVASLGQPCRLHFKLSRLGRQWPAKVGNSRQWSAIAGNGRQHSRQRSAKWPAKWLAMSMSTFRRPTAGHGHGRPRWPGQVDLSRPWRASQGRPRLVQCQTWPVIRREE